MIKKDKVAVIGLGYVGLPLAVLAAENGYEVIGIARNANRVKLINKRIAPFKDARLARELKKVKFLATTDFSLVHTAKIIILCVPTPVHEDRTPDYEPVISATQSIAPYLKKGQLIILESTVNPGVCEEMLVPILETGSHLKVGKDLLLAHCPERISPGDPQWYVRNIPRVVGGFDDRSLKLAVKFYRSIIEGSVTPMMSLKEAEACKVVENAFRNVNIAFVNELAKSFSTLGIDVMHVIAGASTKPFSFMPHYPGCGIGGHCIPVDPYYLIDYARKKSGFDHAFLKLACQTNDEMPQYTVAMTDEALKKMGLKLKNLSVTVLGLAYKPQIDDVRESPALTVIKLLKQEGARVETYDPYVEELSTKQTLDEALTGANVVVIATAHKEFLKIKPEKLIKAGVKLVIDGRNCLPKEKFIKAGLNYRGIGR